MYPCPGTNYRKIAKTYLSENNDNRIPTNQRHYKSHCTSNSQDTLIKKIYFPPNWTEPQIRTGKRAAWALVKRRDSFAPRSSSRPHNDALMLPLERLSFGFKSLFPRNVLNPFTSTQCKFFLKEKKVSNLLNLQMSISLILNP